MKNIMSVCVLSFSFLLAAGCGQSSKEDQASEPEEIAEAPAETTGEPITLHARFDFFDKSGSSSINSNRQLKASIYIETDVRREGSGAGATYSLDTEESRVQGSLLASGSLALKSNEVSSSETYNMRNEWSSLTSNPEGKFLIDLPERSRIGEGLSVGVDIEAPVSGTKKASISSNGQTIDSEITHSRPMFCAPQSAEKDVCKLKFTIDATPTKAQEPAYETLLESAKAAYTYQGKKSPEGGLIMYSGMIPVYGATTRYNNGHFVTELNQEYTANIDEGEISQHIHLVVWSTKRGDKWQPEWVPPLQKPDAQ